MNNDIYYANIYELRGKKITQKKLGTKNLATQNVMFYVSLYNTTTVYDIGNGHYRDLTTGKIYTTKLNKETKIGKLIVDKTSLIPVTKNIPKIPSSRIQPKKLIRRSQVIRPQR